MDESEANLQIAALKEIANKWDNPLAMAGNQVISTSTLPKSIPNTGHRNNAHA
jgi:hypothetical protein